MFCTTIASWWPISSVAHHADTPPSVSPPQAAGHWTELVISPRLRPGLGPASQPCLDSRFSPSGPCAGPPSSSVNASTTAALGFSVPAHSLPRRPSQSFQPSRYSTALVLEMLLPAILLLGVPLPLPPPCMYLRTAWLSSSSPRVCTSYLSRCRHVRTRYCK